MYALLSLYYVDLARCYLMLHESKVECDCGFSEDLIGREKMKLSLIKAF